MKRNSLMRTPLTMGGRAVVLVLGVLLLFAACGDSGGDKTLTLLYWQAPSTLNPYLSSGSKDSDAGAITLQPLVNYGPDGALVSALAEDIPTLENGGISQDLTSITWKLKDDLKWSDGSDFTAHDVVFTWRYCTDEATGCTASSAFSDITSVEALDDLTVKIVFHAPTSYPYTGSRAGSPPARADLLLRRQLAPSRPTHLLDELPRLVLDRHRLSGWNPAHPRHVSLLLPAVTYRHYRSQSNLSHPLTIANSVSGFR